VNHHSPDFDNAISKIQFAADQGKATVHLSQTERAAVALYVIGTDTETTEAESDDDVKPNFIKEGNNENKSKHQKLQPPYKSSLRISPTSNIVEVSLVDLELLCIPTAASWIQARSKCLSCFASTEIFETTGVWTSS